MAKINKNSHVTLWGTGYPKREFLYVDDLAKACIKIMNSKDVVFKKSCNSMFGHINVGSSKEIRVKELAKIIKKIIGFEGEIKWDLTKPDGMKRKLLDSSKIFKLGWKPEVSLKDGILKTYNDFKKNYEYN